MRGKHVIRRKLSGVLPFAGSFGISTVLSLVRQDGTFVLCTMLLNWCATLPCKVVNSLIQYPCTPSGPAAFQSDMFLHTFCTISTVIKNSCWPSAAVFSSWISLSHSAFCLLLLLFFFIITVIVIINVIIIITIIITTIIIIMMM